MSMITSMLGRKQNAQQKGGGGGGRTGGGGGGEIEPVSVDIMEPFMDAISLTAFAAAPSAAAAAVGVPSTASMDWKETAAAHVFMADMPGVRREEVRVEVEEEKVLRISGQRARAAEEKGERWHRVERSSERFVRTVRLPPNANTDGVHAALDNGVLTITIPKDNDRKPHARIIPITN
uniref:SHSP domain-containing protein n=1 Tax=Oryza glumipatula TaxID=40148 RepID=A0A0D9YLP9_9ORYZ